MKKTLIILGVLFTFLHTKVTWAQAGWPSKPIRLMVAYSTGGAGDQLARLLSDQMGRDLNVPVVVENRAGAGGMVGASACKAADPDGHTYCVFLMDVVTVHDILFKNAPYKAAQDFTPVAMLAHINSVIAVPGHGNIHTIADLIQQAKTHPTTTNWGSWGVGSTAHLVHRVLEKTFNIEITHIPYKNTPALTTAVQTGEVDGTVESYSLIPGQVAEGSIRAVAAFGKERLPFMPDVPTLSEQGVPLEATLWYGLFAPAATPMADVARMNAAVNQAVRKIVDARKFDPTWFTTRLLSQAEFSDFVREEAKVWGDIAVQSGITLD